jgi:hypothetical protein
MPPKASATPSATKRTREPEEPPSEERDRLERERLRTEESEDEDEEEDPFADVPASTKRLFSMFSERLQDSMRDMQEQMTETLRTLKKGKEAEEDEEDEEVRAPARGMYGKCGPISIRYPYLDPKVRDSAMAGALPPDSLPLLLDPTSSFAAPPTQHTMEFGFISAGDGSLRPVPARARGDRVAEFIAAIPTPATFMYAWMILMDLMMRGMEDEAAEVYSALQWYGRWIVEKSTTHTWESVCRYHLRVCASRFAGAFHTSMWYKNVDSDAATDLIQIRRADPPAPPSERGTKKKKTSKSASNEVCFNWNTIGCEGCARQHICRSCWPEKKGFHKETSKACPKSRVKTE